MGVSPTLTGDVGLDGRADVDKETHRFGVLMPVPCLLYSSRRLEGGSIRRVSNLENYIKSIYFIKDKKHP